MCIYSTKLSFRSRAFLALSIAEQKDIEHFSNDVMTRDIFREFYNYRCFKWTYKIRFAV